MTTITSLQDLPQLKLKTNIVVTRAGSRFKARYEGHAEAVFGDTPEEATRHLRNGRLGRISTTHKHRKDKY